MSEVKIGDLVQLDADYIDNAISTTGSTLWIVIDTYFQKSVQATIAKVMTGCGIFHYSYVLLRKVA